MLRCAAYLVLKILLLQWCNNWKEVSCAPCCLSLLFSSLIITQETTKISLPHWQAVWTSQPTRSFVWSTSKIVHVHLNKMKKGTALCCTTVSFGAAKLLKRSSWGSIRTPTDVIFRSLLRKTCLLPHSQNWISSTKWVLCYVWRCADYWLFTHSH